MSKEFEEQKKEAFLDYVYKETDKTQECSLHNRPVSECEDVCELFIKEDDHERFDMYARDVNDYSWLQEFVPGLVIYSAGGFFPFQASGYLHGLHLYFRAEQGYASMRLAENKSDCYIPACSLYSSSINTEQYSDTVDELHKRWLSYLLTCIDQLKKPKFLYHFQTDAVDLKKLDEEGIMQNKYDANGDVIHETQLGWGYSVEEAFQEAAACETLRFLVMNRKKYDEKTGEYVPDPERSWSEEKFNKFLMLKNIQPIVVKIEGVDRVYPVPEPIFEVKVPENWRKDDGMIEIPLER